jgi:hypothetical protein
MELPAEVRLEILRELLWTPEPLKLLREASEQANTLPTLPHPVGPQSWDDGVTGTNYTLYPEILRVCRKLNEEGGPVLYGENTVDVVASSNPGFPYGPRFEWMGHLSSLASISESFSVRTRKLRITVDARIPLFATSRAIREVVRELVKVLQANPQWCSLDNRLENQISHPLGGETPSNEEILWPLNLLRRLQHIEFTGVSPQFAAKLSKLTKSDRPIIDLPRMYASLEGYSFRYLDAKFQQMFWNEDLSLTKDAMDAGNVKDFYKYRDRVIWRVEKFLRKRRADFFENDPDPIRSRLSNDEFIAEQDQLENLERENKLVEAL